MILIKFHHLKVTMDCPDHRVIRETREIEAVTGQKVNQATVRHRISPLVSKVRIVENNFHFIMQLFALSRYILYCVTYFDVHRLVVHRTYTHTALQWLTHVIWCSIYWTATLNGFRIQCVNELISFWNVHFTGSKGDKGDKGESGPQGIEGIWKW